MAVSKRLRMEILKRDGYACRLCGRTADDGVKLQIDHVVAVTLGGTDKPENLQALCADCNAGKSSVSADAAVVADVDQKAAVWAQAIEQAAINRRATRLEYDWFADAWGTWHRGDDSIPMDADWRESLATWISRSALNLDDLIELIPAAMKARKLQRADLGVFWTYYCGVVWTTITELEEQARLTLAIVPAVESEWPAYADLTAGGDG